MANNTPLEQIDCEQFAAYLNILGLKFTHVPNETYTPFMSVKAKNKRMGVNPGLPDYLILIPQKGSSMYRLVFIEMKREKGGRVSPSQKEWIAALENTLGVIVTVCNGFDEAKSFIDLQVGIGKHL